MLSRIETGKITALVLTPLVMLLVAALAIDYLYNTRAPSVLPFSNCQKVWGHRGYFRNHQQNSIEAFAEAIRLGARGIELDIYYHKELHRFIVSHDAPNELKGSNTLLLEQVFERFSSNTNYWLDFKNLETSDPATIKRSVSRMEQLAGQYRIRRNLIIESRNPDNLSHFARSGFYTSYWITPKQDRNRLLSAIYIYLVKYRYIRNHFSAISMDHRLYSPDIRDKLKGAPVLLFTVNQLPVIQSLIEDPAVKIILSDQNLYHLKAGHCSD